MRRGDRWIIGLVLFIGLVSMFWRYGLTTAGRMVVVEQDHQIVGRYSLGPHTVGLKTIKLNRNQAIIEFRGGAVRLRDHGKGFCPRGICKRTGWIRREGESIICVPRHLAITVVSKNKSVDGVTR